MLKTVSVGLVLICFPQPLFAQSVEAKAKPTQPVAKETSRPPTQQKSPKTKLELSTEAAGTILLKGYTEIGTIKAEIGQVTVTALRLKNVRGEETQGLQVRALGHTGGSVGFGAAFLDYDEINGLLSGIDYISSVDGGATRLKNYEASYSTKDDLKITIYNKSQGGRAAQVAVGSYGPVSCDISLDQLSKLKGLISSGRATLDSTRQVSQLPQTDAQGVSPTGRGSNP
jgi:hypothetical protein